VEQAGQRVARLKFFQEIEFFLKKALAGKNSAVKGALPAGDESKRSQPRRDLADGWMDA
jgi:hypothetical protein